MAITRTPILDDDGTGTTGTVIDNAWKTELYNQIDGVVGSPSPITLLYSGAGTAVAATAETLATVAVPGLSTRDTLEMYLEAWVSGPAATSLQLDLWVTAATSGQLLTFCGANAGPDLTGFGIGSYRVNLRAPYSGQFVAAAYGAVGIGTTQSRGQVWVRTVAYNVWTAPWTLLVRQISGVPAGTNLVWNAQVYLRKG